MNDITEIVMDWEGPYKLSEFFIDPAMKDKYDRPGVYLWIEELPNGKKRLSYIGRATGRPTLWKRHLQHYAFLVGGLYTIPKEFRRSYKDWIPDWTKEEAAATILSVEKFLNVVEEGFRYAVACSIYLWPSKPDVDVRLIERNLLYDLQPTSTIWGTKSEPVTRLNIRHREPAWLSPEIRDHIKNDVLFV